MMRQIATVLNGTIIAQAIGFAILPLLSRIFDPEALGHFNVYQSVVMVLTVISCLRFDHAILAAKNDSEVAKLAQLAMFAGIMSSVAVLCLAAIIDAADLLKNERTLSFSVYLFPLATIVSAAYLTIGATQTRLEAFGDGARTKIFQAGSNGAATIGLGIAFPHPWSLIAGDLVGKFGAAIFGANRLFSRHGWLRKRASRADLEATFQHFIRFPTVSVLGGLLNNGATFLSPIFFYFAFGASMAGQFALVDRAISLPLGIIVIAVSQVFSAQFARALREGGTEARLLFRRVVAASAILGVVPLLLGLVFAPALFTLVFGGQWAKAGVYAQILAPMYYFSLVAGPVNMALVLLNRQKAQLTWEAVRLALISAFWISVSHMEVTDTITLACFAALNVVIHGAFLLLSHCLLERQLAANSPVESVLSDVELTQ